MKNISESILLFIDSYGKEAFRALKTDSNENIVLTAFNGLYEDIIYDTKESDIRIVGQAFGVLQN